MKRNKHIQIILSFVIIVSIFSCKKYEPPFMPMTPIDVGGKEYYESLDENSFVTIPIKYNSTCDSGIASAGYKVVNNRYNDITLVQSPTIPIPFQNKTVDATINVPVRLGLLSVVIIIYDKDGKMSSQSINIKSVTPSTANLKTLTNVVMSTDPADNQNFFSMYEAIPVFGNNTAITKQLRIDFMAVNMGGGRFISPMAYGANNDYYNASKNALAGFSTISYSFLSSTRPYINRTNFDALNTSADLAKFLTDSVMAKPPAGNFNIINADRRVSDVYGVSTATRGFILGWGYRSHPTATTVLLNEAFALVLVKSVTQKSNGHYILTFDIKASATDERAAYSATPIAPYQPYPL